MEYKEIGKIFLHGVVLMILPMILFYSIEYYISFFISFSFPIGYALLGFLYVFVIPFVAGIINYIITKKLYDDKIEISSFWTYGVFLMLILYTFKMLTTYTPFFVGFPVIVFAIFILGLAGRFIKE